MRVQGTCRCSRVAATRARSLQNQTRRVRCGPLVVMAGPPVPGGGPEPRGLQELATLPASVQPTSALACLCPMPCSDFSYPTMAMCLPGPQPAMICCHSAIGRPYFFSGRHHDP